MAKEIKCTVCRCKAGEIRDASLLKGLRFICERCDNRRMEINVELTKLRKDRAALGLVELRMWLTPEQKERVLKYVARFNRDV